MCGIAGIFNYAEPGREIDRATLIRMTNTIAHRGPDGEGYYYDRCIGLGHRRLAIVDVSATGAQPMANPSESCWLSYNGEFYNHRSYRERLISRGHHFRGRSDTETLLYLMEEEGPECLSGVAGIFALAFWNSRRKELTLARDPLGVKQLYFHDDGRRIVFASEIKAILTCPDVPREPDPEAVNQYLHFHTPLFDRTFFRHIRQIRAGEYMRVSQFGVQVKKYWSVDNFMPIEASVMDRVQDLRDHLQSIVGEQLMADVPIGAFFSGGIDSSAVAAFSARCGTPPECFGVHFSGQGVIDERPYQEAAAKSLGLPLNLVTSDGSTFPDDLFRLIYHQDQPVIGAAMFPMYYVSRLAAGKVKVCLGGQAADEIFGGYARYALTRPLAVIASWYSGRNTVGLPPGHQTVGGNLASQAWDRQNADRILNSISGFRSWEQRYFDHFAKIPQNTWSEIVAAPEFFDRQQCRETFHDVITRSPAQSPADKVMHWDMQTYLTGLFHQDDRMSMAVSLESRVPLADPRLVRFAFQTAVNMKFRGGATKWILRQAVADVLPSLVLNRRKVGFDTPVESWIKGRHNDFVRAVLLSSRCRSRGILDPKAILALLENQTSVHWRDIIWKVLCIESWACVLLDSRLQTSSRADSSSAYVCQPVHDPRALSSAADSSPANLAELAQELREMGFRAAKSRILWEAKLRSGLPRIGEESRRPPACTNGNERTAAALSMPLLFADASRVAPVLISLLPQDSLRHLLDLAREATKGRILSFGRWVADYGNPIDWHAQPHNGRRWPADLHWSKSLMSAAKIGDIKLTWEVARFPQAYVFARAAAVCPEAAGTFHASFTDQVAHFLAHNPPNYGIHWNSGQEIAIRLIAWLFGLSTFSRLGLDCAGLRQFFLDHVNRGSAHIYSHIEFARDSVNNNHLISEALGLYLGGSVSNAQNAERWSRTGRDLLTQEAERQFYPDGGYLQLSHNYHRSVLQMYLCATSLARGADQKPEKVWLHAMERSLDFLVAHQSRDDGRLPNYGANDGTMPCVLSSCDFSDFRPVLQAVSIACRGERIYEVGSWDEEAVWFNGPEALSTPLRNVSRTSVAFKHTGFHVLRGKGRATSFAAFRCGTVLDRFSQIDMLHLDIWWRGQNVLVDSGSYLYNGPGKWHDHFLRTSCHNTITIDGRDQMLHVRKFKNLYCTRAKLLKFDDAGEVTICEGEHYGYTRDVPGCIHNRSVLFLKDENWIVVDRIGGSGTHQIRLGWLGGEFPYRYCPEKAELILHTPQGNFRICTYDALGRPLAGDVVAGSDTPPRGWLSRYYGEKIPVPSLVVGGLIKLPATFVTLLTPGRPSLRTLASKLRIELGSHLVTVPLRSTGPLIWNIDGQFYLPEPSACESL